MFVNHHNYFSDIEEAFIRRRGRNLFLSPKDWALMETWEKREIPLHIVNRAIKDVFDKKQVNNLAYIAPVVDEHFKTWQESQVGKGVEQLSICDECHDTGTILTPVSNPTYSFEMEEVKCPKC